MACDHESADITDESENEEEVAVHAVEEKRFVADDGDELEDGEEACRDDGHEVEGDADSVVAGAVVVPFSWRGTFFETAGCGTADVEVGEAGEGEADHGSAKYEEEREVVAFLETKRSVDFPHSRDEPASRSWLRRI